MGALTGNPSHERVQQLAWQASVQPHVEALLQVTDNDMMVKCVLRHLKECEKQVQKSAADAAKDLLSFLADLETTLRTLKHPDANNFVPAETIAGVTAQVDELKQTITIQLDAWVQQDMRAVIAKVIQDVRTMIKSNFGYAANTV